MKFVKYIKVMLPILVLIGLFVFKRYYVDDLSDAIANNFQSTDTPKKYKQYNLTSDGTNYIGTLLEFGATNCSACRKMEYVLKEIRTEYADELNIKFINTNKKEVLILGKKFGILAIPMQVLMNKQGELVYKHIVYISTDDLSDQIDNFIIKTTQ